MFLSSSQFDMMKNSCLGKTGVEKLITITAYFIIAQGSHQVVKGTTNKFSKDVMFGEDGLGNIVHNGNKRVMAKQHLLKNTYNIQ